MASKTFSFVVSETLRSWSVILIAKQHGFGGSNIQEKQEWLSDCVAQIFHDNEMVYPDELEDFLSEALFNEFDTLVEDGSLKEICQSICSYYKMLQSGKETEVLEAIKLLATKETELPPITFETADASDGEDESKPTMMNSKASNDHPDTSMEIDDEERQDVEDGWEVVRRSKKR